MFCKNCGNPLSVGALFCSNCGTKITGSSPVEQQSAPEVLSPPIIEPQAPVAFADAPQEPEMLADETQSPAEQIFTQDEPAEQPAEFADAPQETAMLTDETQSPAEQIFTQDEPAKQPAAFDDAPQEAAMLTDETQAPDEQTFSQDEPAEQPAAYTSVPAYSYPNLAQQPPLPPAPASKPKSKLRIIIPVILAVIIIGAGSVFGFLYVNRTYTVTFDLGGGTLVDGKLKQEIKNGEAAKAPEAENGFLELSWKEDFSDISNDITVHAVWTKVPIETTELASYVQARTVTVNCVNVYDNEGSGSGFFIDDQGTVVTNYHVIEFAHKINIETADGTKHDVTQVIAFSPTYDLAILSTSVESGEYLSFSETDAVTGEQVYAVGSALGKLDGTFTAGTVSNSKREVGKIDCIQMDTAISNGNSGGPLVNVYGEVVGINTYSYTAGENLNLAIKPSVLDNLKRDNPYTLTEYKEWYTAEIAKSYTPYNQYRNKYSYSIVHTYTTVTNVKCQFSFDVSEDDYYAKGYKKCYEAYAYDYDEANYKKYVEYLKLNGFVFDDDEDFERGTSYYYVNEKDGINVDMFLTDDGEDLVIYVTT